MLPRLWGPASLGLLLLCQCRPADDADEPPPLTQPPVASTPLSGTVNGTAFVPAGVLLVNNSTSDTCDMTLALSDAPLACPPPATPGGDRQVAYAQGARDIEFHLCPQPGSICEFEAYGTCASGYFYAPYRQPPYDESPSAGRVEYGTLSSTDAALRLRANSVIYAGEEELDGHVEGALDAVICP